MATILNTMLLDETKLEHGIPTPNELGLPFAQWREEQINAILGILTSDTKFVILEAPTGIGKSGIAVGLQRFSKRTVSILTSTKQLQDQYVKLGAKTVKGRANFPCLLDPGVTAADAVCTVGGACVHKNGEDPVSHDESSNFPPACPYYLQKWQALGSPVVVHSYSYFLNEANYVGQFSDPHQILVLDEGHTIDAELRNFVAIEYRWDHKVENDTSHEDWTAYANEKLPEISDDAYRLRNRMRKAPTPALAKELRSVNAHLKALEALQTLDKSWVITNTEGFRGRPLYVFKPAWIAEYSNQLLFHHADKVVIMSATILDPELICLMLGIREEDVTVLRMDSPFDPLLRPLVIRPVMKVTGSSRDFYPLVHEIDRIIEDHIEEKGIVHTTSYKLAREIVGSSGQQARMVTHTGQDRLAALELFQSGSRNCLVSPSMGTGVDLPYDELRYQIIAKLPFPDRGDPQIQRRLSVGAYGEDDSTLGNRWYNWATACALVQAYGRAMRAEDDHGITYLLDANWSWWYKQNKNLIPKWVQDAILS